MRKRGEGDKDETFYTGQQVCESTSDIVPAERLPPTRARVSRRSKVVCMAGTSVPVWTGFVAKARGKSARRIWILRVSECRKWVGRKPSSRRGGGRRAASREGPGCMVTHTYTYIHPRADGIVEASKATTHSLCAHQQEMSGRSPPAWTSPWHPTESKHQTCPGSQYSRGIPANGGKKNTKKKHNKTEFQNNPIEGGPCLCLDPFFIFHFSLVC